MGCFGSRYFRPCLAIPAQLVAQKSRQTVRLLLVGLHVAPVGGGTLGVAKRSKSKSHIAQQGRKNDSARFFFCKKKHSSFANPLAGSQLVATRSVNPTTTARVTRISFFSVLFCPLLPSRNQTNSANFLHSNRASPDRSCFRKTTNILSGAGSKLLKKNSILWSLSRGIRKPAPKCLPEKVAN